MLFTPENAAGEAQLLSDALSLPVRIYLSPWGVPAACKASRQLCGCFVCDGELLRLAGEQEGDCVIFLTADYGESAVLLGARTPQGRQFAVLGPAAAAGAAVPGEAFPAWDAAGFQRIHRYLPVRTARQMEAAARLAARALGMDDVPVVRRGAATPSLAPVAAGLAAFPKIARTPAEYRQQLIDAVRQGDVVGLARIQVLYADLNSPAPSGPHALRARKNDFIRFVSLLTEAALAEGLPFADITAFASSFERIAESLEDFLTLNVLLCRAAYDCVRRVAAQKGLPGLPWPMGDILESIVYATDTLPSAGDFARQFGLSPQQLNRRFKAVMGMTLTDYLTLCRMATARSLLCTELPIAQVARQAGFSSVNRMDNAFQHLLGMPPLAYRRIKLGHG